MKGNEALFRNEIENGSDPDLKQFARATLPKIVDHLDRALTASDKAASQRVPAAFHETNIKGGQ